MSKLGSSQKTPSTTKCPKGSSNVNNEEAAVVSFLKQVNYMIRFAYVCTPYCTNLHWNVLVISKIKFGFYSWLYDVIKLVVASEVKF